MDIDSAIMDDKSRAKLEALNNEHVASIVDEYSRLCRPEKIIVLDDSEEGKSIIRNLAVEKGEEKKLNTEGHTIHWDSINDQGRDLENTRVLLPEGKNMSKVIKTIDRDKGTEEVRTLLDGIMKGKTMYVCFYCLGPENSRFSIPALQLTDSLYVVHSENLLYRQGYQEFMRLDGSKNFFHFIHSAGELDERNNTKNIDKRRVYMDLEKERVFTVNNQYAGNSVGLKKLALRLAISKANKEGWLCEHMFVMGVHPEGKKRVTYFTGAYPSACGKTSTAMVPGQSIIGDDITYIRAGDDGFAYAVNVEQGIFGIIADVNPKDDPLIYKALTTPRELIFSNVLNAGGVPYWLNMGKDIPPKGENFSGEWTEGKKDENGKEIPAAHKNARYTIRIKELDNADENLENPEGVPVRAFLYGGRDSDTSVPVLQSLSWAHGVFIGSSIESETTAAAIGKEGVRKHNPMSNIEFLVVPLNVYIENHLKFGENLDKEPLIFATNYFLKKDGKFLNEKVDKKVWLLWMEGRVHGEYNAIETPIGYIPGYDDLKMLFKQVFDRDYTKEEYTEQFTIQITRLLDKIDRIEKIFRQEDDIPDVFWNHLEQQRERLEKAKDKHEKDEISPFDFE